MNRSEVQGSLETNLALLHEKILAAQSNSTTSHYRALCEVADFILQNGPHVNTQDAGKVYLDSKGLQTKKSSCEYYEIFSKHLNLVQVYIHQRAFLIASISSNVKTLIKGDALEKNGKKMFLGIFTYLYSSGFQQAICMTT